MISFICINNTWKYIENIVINRKIINIYCKVQKLRLIIKIESNNKNTFYYFKGSEQNIIKSPALIQSLSLLLKKYSKIYLISSPQ